eukprot:43395-Amphidinium_carterae.2
MVANLAEACSREKGREGMVMQHMNGLVVDPAQVPLPDDEDDLLASPHHDFHFWRCSEDVLRTQALAAQTPIPDSDDEACDKRVAMPKEIHPSVRSRASRIRMPPASFAMAEIAAQVPIPDDDDEEENSETPRVANGTQFFNLHDDDDL